MKIVSVRIDDTKDGPVMTLYGRRLKNRVVISRTNIKDKTRPEVIAIAQAAEQTYRDELEV